MKKNIRLNNYVRLLIEARAAESKAASETQFYRDKLETLLKKRKSKKYSDNEVEAEFTEYTKQINDMNKIKKLLKNKLPKQKLKLALVTARYK